MRDKHEGTDLHPPMSGRAARYLVGTGTVLLALLLRTPASTPSREMSASIDKT